MKKVIFTESQIRKILGEDTWSYLGNTERDSSEPSTSEFADGGLTSDKNTEGEETASPITDKISSVETPGANMFRKNYQRGGLCENKKKRVNEANNRITNKKIKLSPWQKEKIEQSIKNNPNNKEGRKVAINLIRNGELTYNNANVIKSRLGDGKNSVIPTKTLKSIDNKRKTIENADNMSQETSQPITANIQTGQKGTKHKGKTENNFTFQYYN